MPRLRSRKKLEPVKTEDEEKAETVSTDRVGNDSPKEEPENSQNNNDAASEEPSNESEDEAPESVSLTASKDAAIAKRHEEKAAIDALKEKEKQRRRNKDEILRKQKESRLGREKSRIADEVLLKVAEKQKQVAKQTEMEKSNIHMTFDDDDVDNDDDQVINMADDNEDQKGLHLVVLNQTKKRKKGVLDSANAFLNNHFYGDRLKRIGTLDEENRNRKKRRFGPAVKFTKT